MDLMISQSMKVALLLCSLSSLLEKEPFMASVNTLQKEKMTWNYVSMLFIEESKGLGQNIKREMTMTPAETGTLAALESRNILQESGGRKPNVPSIRCYSCGNIGLISSE